jgi:hypothetical protein
MRIIQLHLIEINSSNLTINANLQVLETINESKNLLNSSPCSFSVYILFGFVFEEWSLNNVGSIGAYVISGEIISFMC